nr:MAG TPA: tail tape measure protein [Caudoviricetes sp.]
MASNNSVKIIISAHDSASEVFAKLAAASKSATNEVEASFKRQQTAAGNAHKSFRDFLTNTQSGLSRMSSGLDNAASRVGSFLKTVAGVAITGSAGFLAMGKAAFEQVRNVENASYALKAYEKDGNAVNKVLQDLVKYARSDTGVLFNRSDLFAAASTLKMYGQETNTLVDKVKILSKGVSLGKTTFQELASILGRVAATGSLDATTFDMLIERGIGLDKSLRGTKITADNLFKALDKALPDSLLEGRANTIDGALIRVQSAFRNLGMQILGVDADTNKFIAGGAGDRLMNLIRDLTKEMGKPEMKQAMKDLGDQLAKLAEEVIPKILDALKWLSENFDKVVLAAKIAAGAFVALKVAALGLKVINVVTGVVKGLHGAFLTCQTAAQGFKLGMEGITGASQGVVSAKIGTAFGVIAGAVKKATIQVVKLGIAFATNPIGATIIAVTALVAGFIWLWNNVEGFRNFFIGVWDGIKKGVDDFAKWFKDSWDNTVKFFKDLWKGISKWFSDVWNGVKDVFNAVVAWIKEWGLTVLAVIFWPFSLLLGFIIMKWNEISAFFNGIAKWFSDFFKAVWQVIVDIFSPVVQFFSDMFWIAWSTVVNIWKAAVEFFQGLWQGIVDIFTVVGQWFGDRFREAWTAICDTWNQVAGFFRDVWNKIVGVFQSVGQWFSDRFREAWDNIKRIFAPVGEFFGNLWNTIVSKFKDIGRMVGEAISNTVKTAINWLIKKAEDSINGFIGLINGAANIINHIPGVHIPKVPEVRFKKLAAGTEHAEGGRYLVGENGPEMVTLPRGSKVMPAQRTENYLKENRERGNININIDAKIYKDTDAYQLASRIGYLVSQA